MNESRTERIYLLMLQALKSLERGMRGHPLFFQFQRVGIQVLKNQWVSTRFVNQIPGASTLLLLEELNNAGIVALSVLAVYDATKALAVLR